MWFDDQNEIAVDRRKILFSTSLTASYILVRDQAYLLVEIELYAPVVEYSIHS